MAFGINKSEKKEQAAKTTAFSKVQIAASDRYKDRKDIVNTLLADNKGYSFEEVDALINKFMKGKVN